MPENQFANIFIEGNEQSIFAQCSCKHRGIRDAGRRFADPQHVMSSTAQLDHAICRHGLVGAQPHAASWADSKNPLVIETFLSVRDARADLFRRELIIARYFLFRPALRDQAEDELYCKPRSPNHRLANQNGRVSGYLFAPIHINTLQPHAKPCQA